MVRQAQAGADIPGCSCGGQ